MGAVACGFNQNGQCGIPMLGDQLMYMEVAAGTFHTVLLRSDGSAVACGGNGCGQSSIPSLDGQVTYKSCCRRKQVQQLTVIYESGTAVVFACVSMGGSETCRIVSSKEDTLQFLYCCLGRALRGGLGEHEIVVPGGELLANRVVATPLDPVSVLIVKRRRLV